MKTYKPTTSGRRGMTGADFSALSKVKPYRNLLKRFQRKKGRSGGKITVRHKGGGHKRLYRIIDFRQNKLDIPAKVISLEYDPNRTCFIALIRYEDSEKRYIIAPRSLKVGDEIICSSEAPLTIGNRMMMKNIPVGTQVHNIELMPGKGGQIVRAAGSSAQIMAHEGGYVHLTLPSKEIRMAPENAMASIGQISNPEHSFVQLGKAGRSRWLGIRPAVRGTAMNPVDHPHGGGEGRQPLGMHPKTPWGKPALGLKTRKRKKLSNRYIIARRKK